MLSQYLYQLESIFDLISCVNWPDSTSCQFWSQQLALFMEMQLNHRRNALKNSDYSIPNSFLGREPPINEVRTGTINNSADPNTPIIKAKL